MSISGIASDPTVNQNYASNPFQQVKKDFAALKSSLASGDVDAAQNAFATLTQDLQSIGKTQGAQQSGTGGPPDNLAAIGDALQKGDITGAQNALQTLQKDMQQTRQMQAGNQTKGAHHHHHHHHSGGAQNSASNPFTDLSAIGSALQSNDLTGAQKAFAALQQDLGNADSQNTTMTSSATSATAGTGLTSLGNALQSNDLSGAQNAFATLMQDLQNSLTTLSNGDAGKAVGTNVDVST